MGTRGQRFAIVVHDGVAARVEVEQPGQFKVSAAEAVLGQLSHLPSQLIISSRRPPGHPLHLRNDLEQVADQADIGDLEDRRLAVLVDRDDGARVLDAGEMLDRARDADRHVQLRRDDLAGLADLQLIRRVAGIHRRARGAHRRTELSARL